MVIAVRAKRKKMFAADAKLIPIPFKMCFDKIELEGVVTRRNWRVRGKNTRRAHLLRRLVKCFTGLHEFTNSFQ